MFNVPLHFLIVHFAIALTVMAAVFDARAYLGKRPETHKNGIRDDSLGRSGSGPGDADGSCSFLAMSITVSGATFHAASGLITGLVLMAVLMIGYSAEARKHETLKSKLEPSGWHWKCSQRWRSL